MGSQQLAGSRLLVVENEYYLADDARSVLCDEGAEVLGPVATVAEASVLIENSASIQAVLLDVNLRGEMAFEVADALQGRGIPFAFVTGYDRTALPERFATVPRLEKPVNPAQLIKFFAKLTGPTSP